jgi:DNA repair protein RadC
MSIQSLPADARPREKLLARGPQALADAELLALLLRTGMAGRGVLTLAQDVVDALGGMGGFLNATDAQLKAVKGLGPAKRAELLAVAEIARRALAQPLREQPVMDQPDTVKAHLQWLLAGKAHECFVVLFVDNSMKLIAHEEMFRGSLSEAAVYPREVAVRALHHHAAAVLLAHNHPSGEALISNADRSVTRRVEAALGLLDIRVVDHLIVTRAACVSLKDQGGW